MKLSCTKENLSKALSLVGGVTGKNINLPILSNVLIRTGDQKVELIATNLELAVVVNLRAIIEDSGTFTVPARTLSDFIALLPNEKIDIQLSQNELMVKCGRSSTKIKGASAEDFPVIPTLDNGQGFLLKAEDLKTGISQVICATAKNEIRPELSGVFFGFNVENSGELVLAATDSYRLAERKIPLLQKNSENKVIVPMRTAQEIAHTLSLEEILEGEKTVRVMVGENQIMVNYGNTQIISRLVDGQYPDYTQIIPREFNTVAMVETNQLIKEMKAGGLFTTTGVNAIKLSVKSAEKIIDVSSTSTQTGEYQSELEAEITGGDVDAMLNNRYILDGLNNLMSEKVEIKLVNSDSPCIFAPFDRKDYLYIVMPIRQ